MDYTILTEHFVLVERCIAENKTDILVGIHGIITLDSVYS